MRYDTHITRTHTHLGSRLLMWACWRLGEVLVPSSVSDTEEMRKASEPPAMSARVYTGCSPSGPHLPAVRCKLGSLVIPMISSSGTSVKWLAERKFVCQGYSICLHPFSICGYKCLRTYEVTTLAACIWLTNASFNIYNIYIYIFAIHPSMNQSVLPYIHLRVHVHHLHTSVDASHH